MLSDLKVYWTNERQAHVVALHFMLHILDKLIKCSYTSPPLLDIIDARPRIILNNCLFMPAFHSASGWMTLIFKGGKKRKEVTLKNVFSCKSCIQILANKGIKLSLNILYFTRSPISSVGKFVSSQNEVSPTLF